MTTQPLPTGSVLLHIGPQKTGSTAMQVAMHEARAALAEHGVHYVGSHPVEREAGWFALGVGSPIGRPPAREEAWRRLADEIRDAELPRVVLSNENFARADDAAVARILTATGSHRTHVVFIARRLDRLLPSHWQERVKARATMSYPEYLRAMLQPDPTGWYAKLLWGPLDFISVAARWAEKIDRSRIIVVVADEGDRTSTTTAFEHLLDLPEGFLVAPRNPANRSLGYVEAEAIRQLNRLSLEEDWQDVEYRKLIQLGVVRALKRRPAADGPRVGIPEWALTRVAELADAQIEAFAASGVRVIGDLDRLRVRSRVQPADEPPEITAIPLDVVADVASGLRAGGERLRRYDRRNALKSIRTTGTQELTGRQLVRLLARRVANRFRMR